MYEGIFTKKEKASYVAENAYLCIVKNKRVMSKFVVYYLAFSLLMVMGGGLRNYQCKKCGTLVKSTSTPSSLNCPARGSHSWQNLGEMGSENYCCKKCGTWVMNRSTPSSLGCPAGASHSWNHLSRVGEYSYQCKKCGLVIPSQRTPSSLGCPQGSSHSWTKLGRYN